MPVTSVIIDPQLVKIIPETLARRHQAIPVFEKEKVLTLTMMDPLNVFAINDIQQATGIGI